jgi:HTH-type transcriptional regulator/antitoxin HipB
VPVPVLPVHRFGGFMPQAKKTKAKKGIKTPELHVSEMMRSARESAGVSQEDLALRLNTKRTAISRIENHAEDIKLSTLARVATALGKTLKVKIV